VIGTAAATIIAGAVVDFSDQEGDALLRQALVHEAHFAKGHERKRPHRFGDHSAFSLLGSLVFSAQGRGLLCGRQVRGEEHAHKRNEGWVHAEVEDRTAVASQAILVRRKPKQGNLAHLKNLWCKKKA
jgi:hypothetical protein